MDPFLNSTLSFHIVKGLYKLSATNYRLLEVEVVNLSYVSKLVVFFSFWETSVLGIVPSGKT